MRPSQPLFRKLTRLALTTKQAAKGGGYYKGTGTGPLGVHTKHGGYRILWRLVRTYVVPSELKDCKLSPFVTKVVTKQDVKALNQGLRYGRMGGANYLGQWKEENATD